MLFCNSVISGAELDALISDPGMKAGGVFGMTYFKKGEPIHVFFREDILMTPYYGELLVAHEGEQVRQALEMFESNIKHPQEEREARAFTKCLSTAFSLFPEIMVYPPRSSTPQIQEAQKMVIRYAVIGFIAHFKQCSEESVERVKKLEDFERVLKYASFVFDYDQNPAFREINLRIHDEMTKKYSIKEEGQIPRFT